MGKLLELIDHLLHKKYVQQAISSLTDHDVVLGPSADGGYYLIGISCKIPDLFSGIDWGTDKVFEETLKKARANKLDFSVLPFWYDIDTIKELRFMAIHLDALDDSDYIRTRAMIKRLEGINNLSLKRGRL